MCCHLFVLAQKVIISHLLAPMRSVGCGLPRVSLCSVYCSSTTVLCDTISMEEELLHCPRLPDSSTWIVPDTPVRKASSNDEECGHFSDFRRWPTTSIVSVVFVRSDSEAIVAAT